MKKKKFSHKQAIIGLTSIIMTTTATVAVFSLSILLGGQTGLMILMGLFLASLFYYVSGRNV